MIHQTPKCPCGKYKKDAVIRIIGKDGVVSMIGLPICDKCLVIDVEKDMVLELLENE